VPERPAGVRAALDLTIKKNKKNNNNPGTRAIFIIGYL
jgi:hypothetical protein